MKFSNKDQSPKVDVKQLIEKAFREGYEKGAEVKLSVDVPYAKLHGDQLKHFHHQSLAWPDVEEAFAHSATAKTIADL